MLPVINFCDYTYTFRVKKATKQHQAIQTLQSLAPDKNCSKCEWNR